MHEHDAVAVERMAIRVGKSALCSGTYMGEDETRGRFGAQTKQIDAVPGGDGGGENARGGAKGRRGVVSQAEAIAVVWSAGVLRSLDKSKLESIQT